MIKNNERNIWSNIEKGGGTSIKIMKDRRSNYSGVQGLRGGSIIPLFIENGFSNNGAVRYTQDQQMGENCIHDPIHSDTDPKNEIGVIGMETNSIIYIHFLTFIRYNIHLTLRADM